MDEADFKGKVTGEVRWAMNGSYCYFHPNDLPFDTACSQKVQSDVNRASVELARLDGMLRLIGEDSVKMLTRNLTLRESTSSSSIEGTRSTVDGIFRSEKVKEQDEVLNRDNQEVLNYRNALLRGFEQLPVGGKITADMIRDIHRILMDGVRGSNKSPGEFKTSQNAIGRVSDTLETAKMVPASPESVDHLIDNWIDYVNSDDVDTVEKVAMAHYQFEAIHPFRDGNGRVGRLLSLMILRRDGLLRYPILYMSGYLNANRSEYIDLLYKVSTSDAIDDWVRFFVNGLNIQARSTAATVEALLRYKDRMIASAGNITEAHVIEMLFRNPYITSTDVVDTLGISSPTANKVLDAMVSSGILSEVTGRKRNRLYRADGIMEILS